MANRTLSRDTVEKLLQWLEDNRGPRAELRRCKSLRESYLEPTCIQGRDRWRCEDGTRLRHGGLVLVLSLAAHLGKEHGDLSPGRAMAFGHDRPILSGLRFRTILKSETDEELFNQLRRALPALKKKLDPTQFLNDAYWFFHENDSTRRQWATDYYETCEKFKGDF